MSVFYPPNIRLEPNVAQAIRDRLLEDGCDELKVLMASDYSLLILEYDLDVREMFKYSQIIKKLKY